MLRALVTACLMTLPLAGVADDRAELLSPQKRVLFLGDSITHAGGYIVILEASIRDLCPGEVPTFINLGLPSETCSGLSEPDHPFPRPDVHERLDRALAKVRPDVVLACYGMNDGIYHPLSEQRFTAYQEGVNRLIEKVHAAGAKLVLLTPPPFDPVPLRDQGKLLPEGKEKYAYFAMYERYDDVLARYAEWIMEQGDRVALTIDVHTPSKRYAAAKRDVDPGFTLAPDGIHPNAEGHQVFADAVLAALGIDQRELDPALLELVRKRQRLMHDAWLSNVGHERPGMRDGLPLDVAVEQAAGIDDEIRAFQDPGRIESVLTRTISFQVEQDSLANVMAALEAKVQSLDDATRRFRIRLMAKELQYAGITRNQRIRDYHGESRTIAETLTELVVKANPFPGVDRPSHPDQTLVWVVAADPEGGGDRIVLITTRRAASERYTLPDVFRLRVNP